MAHKKYDQFVSLKEWIDIYFGFILCLHPWMFKMGQKQLKDYYI